MQTASSSNRIMKFSKGGNQEARGNKGCGAMYVEGIEEELDDAGRYPPLTVPFLELTVPPLIGRRRRVVSR